VRSVARKAAVSRKVVERILPPANSVSRTSALEGRFYPKFVRSLNEYADVVAENLAQDFVYLPSV